MCLEWMMCGRQKYLLLLEINWEKKYHDFIWHVMFNILRWHWWSTATLTLGTVLQCTSLCVNFLFFLIFSHLPGVIYLRVGSIFIFKFLLWTLYSWVVLLFLSIYCLLFLPHNKPMLGRLLPLFPERWLPGQRRFDSFGFQLLLKCGREDCGNEERI